MERIPMPSLLIRDFSAGKNSRLPGNLIPDNAVQDILNWEFNVNGGPKTRNGTSKYNPIAVGAGGAITGMFLCKYNDGTRKFVVSEGTELHVDAAGVFSSIKTGLTNGQYPQMAMLANLAVFVNGAEAPQKYNGTTVSDLGGSPPADPSIICAHRNHLFMAGASADPSKITACAVNTPEDWTTPNDSWTGYCGYQDGDPPIAFLSFMDTFLYVFKRQAIWRILGSTGNSSSANVFTPERVAFLTGTVARFSVVSIGSDAFFYDVEGIKSLADTERAAGIEYPNLTFNIQNDIIGLKTQNYSMFYGVNHKTKSQYWLAVAEPGQTNNNIVIVLDYSLRTPGPAGTLLPAATIFKFTEPKNIISLALIEATTGQDILYAGSHDGYIYQLDTGTNDNESAFTKRLKTKAYDLNLPNIYKNFPYLFSRIKQGANGSFTLNIKWDLDSEVETGGSYDMTIASAGTKWGAKKWGQFKWGAKRVTAKDICLPQYGRTIGQNIAFTFTNTGKDEPIEIQEFVLQGEPVGVLGPK